MRPVHTLRIGGVLAQPKRRPNENLSQAKAGVIDCLTRSRLRQLQHQFGDRLRCDEYPQVLPVPLHRKAHGILEYAGGAPPAFGCRQVNEVQPIKYSTTESLPLFPRPNRAGPSIVLGDHARDASVEFLFRLGDRAHDASVEFYVAVTKPLKDRLMFLLLLVDRGQFPLQEPLVYRIMGRAPFAAYLLRLLTCCDEQNRHRAKWMPGSAGVIFR